MIGVGVNIISVGNVGVFLNEMFPQRKVLDAGEEIWEGFWGVLGGYDGKLGSWLVV